jgi:DNA-directed RNA polymerase specialized sigma24 family protein
MAKRRKTIDTTRLTANLINPKPEIAHHEVKAVPASKTLVQEIPATDLLSDLREVGERDSDAIRELGRRYDGLIDRRLCTRGIRDWQDRESLKQDIWLKVQKLVRRAPDERGAWDPRRAAAAADPLAPLLSTIASSKAIDFLRKRDRARKRIEGYLEDRKHWGDNVSEYAFTNRGARRRIAAKGPVSVEPKPFEAGATRRAAAAARGQLLATVAGLPEKIRRPLLLEAEGKTCVEIGRVVGVVPSTAWKRANKAKASVIASLQVRAG